MKKIIYNLQNLKEFFTEIKDTDISNGYLISFEKYNKIRSIQSNKLYWLWLNCIAEETGNDSDILHEYFKNKYLKKYYSECFESQLLITITTTKLDNKQFWEYLEKIKMFASTELNIILPEPKDKEFEEFLSYYSRKI